MNEPVTAPQRIAITGVLGFVASRLLPHLLERGDRVIGIVRPSRDAASLEARGIEVRRADLTDPATMNGAFAGAEAVVHLSGLAQVCGMLPAIEAAGVKRGVFVSSAGVHTKLVSAGADAKRRGEQALRDSTLGYTILRPSMIYGTPRDRNMVRLLETIRRFGFVFVPGGGATLQQPVHVDDLVAAILAALDRPQAARGEYDVGGPEPISLREVIRESADALGRRATIIPVPLKPAHLAVRLLKTLKLPSPVSPEQVLRLTESKAVDISPARRDLGFEPRPFREGIRAEAKELPV